MKQDQAKQILKRLEGVYPKNPFSNQQGVQEYLSAVEKMDYDAALEAVEEIISTSNFMPTIAELNNMYKDFKRSRDIQEVFGECSICNGKGLKQYFKTINNVPYEYFARCECKLGEKYAYDGRQAKKHPSDYYMLTIAEAQQMGFKFKEEMQYEPVNASVIASKARQFCRG